MPPKSRAIPRKISKPSRPMMRNREATYRPFKFAVPKSRIPVKKKVKNDSQDSIEKFDLRKEQGNSTVSQSRAVTGGKKIVPASVNTRLSVKSAELNAELLVPLNESNNSKDESSSKNRKISLRKKQANTINTNNLKVQNTDLLTPTAQQKKRISVRKLINEFAPSNTNVKEPKSKKVAMDKNALSKSLKPLNKNIAVSYDKEHLEASRDTNNSVVETINNIPTAMVEDILPSSEMLSKGNENITFTAGKGISQKINIKDSITDSKEISVFNKTSPCIIKIKACSSTERNDNIEPVFENKQMRENLKNNIPAKYASSQRALNLRIQPEDSNNRNWVEKPRLKRGSLQKESGKKEARAEIDENQTILLWMEGKKKKKAADVTDLDVAFAVVKKVFKNFSTVTMSSKTRALLLKYEETVEKQLLETLESVVSLTALSKNILKISKGINKKGSELGTLTDRKINLKHKILMEMEES